MNDKKFLVEAIEKSKESVAIGGFPVGVILVRDNEIVSTGLSNGKQLNDPTSHAEIAAIREACQKLRTRNLKDLVLYSSLEPCLMCYAASSWASIRRIIYACNRNRVSKQHYEGIHDLNILNKTMRHPIEMIHFVKLEEKALKVISDWGKVII
jgi:tRNA(Arg) A34 adenosine deaminase TadA